MAYEIFISRGVASIHHAEQRFPPSGPRHQAAHSRRWQSTEAAQAKSDGTGGAFYVRMDLELGSPGALDDGSVIPGTAPEGHARANPAQGLLGQKSVGENFSTDADGGTSEKQRLLLTSSDYRTGTDEIDVGSQLWERSNEDQSPQHVSGLSTCSTRQTSRVKGSDQPVQLQSSSPGAPTPPPNLSDSSTKWTSDKVYRHATNSAVTFVDGNLDAPHLSGEYPSTTEEPSKSTESASTSSCSLSGTQSNPFDLYLDNMPSSGFSNDESLFLDPFLGLPLHNERHASDLSDLSGYIRPQAFSRHRDTLARVDWPRNHVEGNEDEGFHSDDEECTDSSSLNQMTTTTHVRSVSQLPAEVLHQVFSYLQPCDFEAARHACRSWFVASLDRRLAQTMMKRAGCYSAFLTDLSRSTQLDNTSEHWLASKRLATESRLSAAWHGSSLQINNGHTSSRLSLRQTVDFTQLMSRHASQEITDDRTFTVSSCGKFLLVTSGCNIFVYAMASGNATFHPLVQLVADSRVIAVSMDTSARRFAVAALLDGRTGACWEIDDIVVNDALGTFYSTIANDTQQEPKHATPPPAKQDEISIIAEGMDIELPQSIQFQQLDSPSDSVIVDDVATNGKSNLAIRLGDLPQLPLAVRVKPSAVYRNLGTKNDAPRSVAICPQRKCTAFGCKAGIELHWVDASTGADLNRWFPSAAPSDCLYFLPQRSGIDSAKKLRLISSALSPDVKSKSGSVGTSSLSTRQRAHSMLKLFQGNHHLSNTSQAQSNNRRMDCDHYRAIPLSDGQHMLFTDPVTGLLCLGSDAPLGGPTKLVRKACMVPPPTEGVDQFESPVYYSAASDLEWGVRIVAAYADGRIVLYNIPSDCFERLRHIRSSPEVWDEWGGNAGQSDLMMDAFMMSREIAMANAGQDDTSVFRSLQIDGALLGYVDADVQALAVDTSNGGFKLWTFHSSGQATQMDIYVPRDHHMLSQVVGSDGLIREKLLTPLPKAILKGHDNTPYDVAVDQEEDYFGSRVRFVGLDGCCDHKHSSMCGPMVHKNEIDYTDLPRDEGISMTPGASDDEEDDRPLQVELLTDWRAESLLRPYIVNVAWIEAH